MATIVAAVLSLLAIEPDPAAAQVVTGTTFSLRGGVATHVAGFVREDEDTPWLEYQHRLEDGPMVGAGIALPLGPPGIALRLDVDALPGASLAREDGPRLEAENGEGEGTVWWVTGSVAWTPAGLCGAVCAGLSAGAGVVRVPLRYREIRDDVISGFLEPQTTRAFRIGVEAGAPAVTEALTLTLAWHVAPLDAGEEWDTVTPLHVLTAGVALRWSPWS